MRLFVCVLLFCCSTYAYKDGSFNLGLSYLSYQSFSKITATDDGKKQILGTGFTPLYLSYDTQIGSGYFLSPSLTYTLAQTESKGGGNKESVMMLALPFGKNFSGSQNWDWNVSFGIFQYSLIGEGGTKQLNNGTGYSTFALPGKTISSTNISTGAGVGYNFDKFKINSDLLILGLMSSDKRTMSLMFNFLYKWDL